jgi:hypothetical protein
MSEPEYAAALDRYTEMYQAELAAQGKSEPDWAGRGFNTPYREPDPEPLPEAEPQTGA